MNVCFETFGCRLNRAEALEEEAAYLAKGWTRTEKHADADLIIVRGCSVTAHAQHDCERMIKHLRRKYPNKRIVVQGCMESSLKNATAAAATHLHSAVAMPDAPTATDAFAVPTRTARAYLKVQDGCAGKCTFCIVPKFRGESTSVPFDTLMDKARRFIDAGYHEIVVTGCNLSLYASQGKRLPELLTALAQLTPDCRIRLGSLEPGACALETVRALAAQPNFCRFLHIPIQSGSARILLAMRRPYEAKDVHELLDTAVELMPDLGLGCDLMTGFPSESETDFLATKGLLKKYPFSNAHVFPFSERPGTLAASMSLKVDKKVRSSRAHALAELAREKRKAFAKKFVGRRVEVLIEDAAHGAGWTSEYLWFKGTGTCERKRLVSALTFSTVSDHLHGRIG